MKLAIDMHVHTLHSKDGLSSVKEILLAARAKGLDGVAITDHNTTEGLDEAERIARRLGMVLIKGQEVRCEEGDVLVYGIDESFLKGIKAQRLLKRVKSAGGYAFIAHPFGRLFHWKSCSGTKLFHIIREFDGVEAFNSRSAIGNWKALILTMQLNTSMIAGSDAHHWKEVGNAYTIVDSPKKDAECVLEEIAKGNCSIAGRKTSLPRILRWYCQRVGRKIIP